MTIRREAACLRGWAGRGHKTRVSGRRRVIVSGNSEQLADLKLGHYTRQLKRRGTLLCGSRKEAVEGRSVIDQVPRSQQISISRGASRFQLRDANLSGWSRVFLSDRHSISEAVPSQDEKLTMRPQRSETQ